MSGNICPLSMTKEVHIACVQTCKFFVNGQCLLVAALTKYTNSK